MLVADIGRVSDIEQKTDYLQLEETAVTACLKARPEEGPSRLRGSTCWESRQSPVSETGMHDALPSLLRFPQSASSLQSA